MTRRAPLAASAVLLLLGCRSAAPEVPIPQDCPLLVVLSSNEFDNAGLVRPAFNGLREITGEFEVRRVAAGAALPRTQRRGRWWGGTQRYPLEFGMPGTAWEPIGRRVDEYSYEVDPGTYQIVVKYRSVVSRATCLAASDPFTVKKTSVWIITN